MIHFPLLIKQLAIEEWRMHAEMFDSRRTKSFPIVISVFVFIGTFALFSIDVSPDILTTGFLIGVFALGLQTGTIGFISSELMRNQLGDVTSLLFSTRIHPVDERQMLLAFIIKDLLFYIGLFILPLTIAFGLAGTVTGSTPPTFPITIVIAGLSFFVLGMGTMVIVTVFAQNQWIRIGTIVMIAGTLIGAYTQLNSLLNPIMWALAILLGGLGFVISVLSFDSSQLSRQRSPLIEWSLPIRSTQDFVPGPIYAVTEYTLRNIHRSSGGFLKIPLFGGIVIGIPLLVAVVISEYMGLSFSSFFLVSVISSSIGLPVFTWLFRSDNKAIYDIQPFTEENIVKGKLIAYYMLTLPVIALAIVSLYWNPASFIEIVLGTLTYMTVIYYIFSVLIHFAGRSPESTLFDSTVYAKVAISIGTAFLPLITIGFFIAIIPAIPQTISIFVIGFNILIAILGFYFISKSY